MKHAALVVFVGTVLAFPASGVTLPANKWVAMNEPAAGVQMLGWEEARYAPDLKGILYYGAYRSYTSENQNAIWLYRFKENRWHLLHVNMFLTRSEMASDGGHTSGKMFYDEARRTLVHGGLVSMSRNDRFRTWVFDPLALVGWDAAPRNPTANIEYDGASTYVPELKASLQYRSDRGAWAYDALANRWKQLSKPGQGPAAATETVYDPKRKRVLAFGGSQGHYIGKAFKTFNDLWGFDLEAKTWRKLKTKNPPPTRGWPQMAVSTAADALLLCGGFTGEITPRGVAKWRDDTWTLDLEKLEWKPLASAKPAPSSAYSNHLAYDPENDVFLYVAKPPKNLGYGYQCAMYALKYRGKKATRPQPASIAPRPAYDLKSLPKPKGTWGPLGGGQVTAVKGWAFWPSLASKGGELLLAFGEYDPPGRYVDEGCYVYAFRYAGGRWSRLGKRAVSDPGVHSQAPSAAFDSAGRPVVAYQHSRPWKPVKIDIRRFEGGWKPVGALKTAFMPAFPALAGGPKKLAVAWQGHPKGGKGIGSYVATLSAESWQPVAGGKALNVLGPAATRGQFASLARDSKDRLVAAWQEQKAGYNGENATLERIHVRRLELGKWTELGKAVPISDPKARAVSYAMALHGGEPVTAVCEGTDGGRAKLHVRAWKGGGWQLLGAKPLNVLGTGSGALKPALASDGKNLYVAWPEFLPGRPPLLFVKKWDGAKWTLVGGPLNNAPGKGSAHRPTMAVLGGKPAVAWTEQVPCGTVMRRIYVKALR